MGQVTDAFLLQVAGIAATLLGFFIIGVFFYVQRGIFPQAAEQAQVYMRASTKAIVVLYGITLLLALALVVLANLWVRIAYLGLSVLLLWSVTQTSIAVYRLHRALDIRVMSQVGLWVAAATIVLLPWVLGSINPVRADFTWALLMTGVFAFISSASLVLSAFDISAMEASVRPRKREKVVAHDKGL